MGPPGLDATLELFQSAMQKLEMAVYRQLSLSVKAIIIGHLVAHLITAVLLTSLAGGYLSTPMTVFSTNYFMVPNKHKRQVTLEFVTITKLVSLLLKFAVRKRNI